MGRNHGTLLLPSQRTLPETLMGWSLSIAMSAGIGGMPHPSFSSASEKHVSYLWIALNKKQYLKMWWLIIVSLWHFWNLGCFFTPFPIPKAPLGSWNSSPVGIFAVQPQLFPHVWHLYEDSPSKKTCKITQYIPLNKVCMEVIRRSDFPWNTTSSYWGTPWLRKPPKTPRRIRSTALMPSLQQACGWQNNHPNAFCHGNNPRRVQSRGKNGRNKHQMLWIIMGL